MPKGGGSKTPQLDHFPLNTDMVEKQGGKKVRLKKKTHTHILHPLHKCLHKAYNPSFNSCKPDAKLHSINKYKTLEDNADSKRT